jgi:hypothetical protein
MKKLMMMFAVAGVLVCCKEKKEVEATKEVTTVESTQEKKVTDHEPGSPEDWARYFEWRNLRGLPIKTMKGKKMVDCNERVIDFAETSHNIENQARDVNLWFKYSTGYNRGDSKVNYYTSTQAEATVEGILSFMHENVHPITCYDGWLKVAHTGNGANVTFSRSEVFDNTLTLYSEPLLLGIRNKLVAAHATDIRVDFFDIQMFVLRRNKPESESKLAMRVTYNTPDNQHHEVYYDMSDNPL